MKCYSLVTLYYIISLKADWGIFWGRQFTTYLDASKNLADWADSSTLQHYFCYCYCFTLS